MNSGRIFELYARRGHSLIDHGLNEAALPINAAVEAIGLFSGGGWKILGGDVYSRSINKLFESTYENWFYSGDSCQESINLARAFIESLVDRDVYVVFVVEPYFRRD
ncbi:Imm40 family immunity protein [Comamonas sp.]|uniref:Imm40 family immunity protein n=1 Tax=Comamonas sp. TaxID=34028 RepID=UPI0028A0B974|nr:Imm40 family immunity protein [Comamonas sp.]